MNKPRKFVYNTGQNFKNPVGSSQSFPKSNASCKPAESRNIPKMDVDDFDLCLDFDDDDDITSTMSAADLDRMELEATKKFGLHQATSNKYGERVFQADTQGKDVGTIRIVDTQAHVQGKATSSLTQNRGSQKVQGSDRLRSCTTERRDPAPSTSQLQQLATQLEEYKSKISRLENSIYEKDGELKILRSSLEQNRQENAEKSEKIVQLKNKQNIEQTQREANLAKEVTSLKTRICFQEQELREQAKKIESQAKAFSVTNAVKRKAEIEAPNNSFDLENSFISTQLSSCKKIPRVSERVSSVKTEVAKVTRKSPVRNSTAEQVESCSNQSTKQEFVHSSECKGLQLIRNLILMQNSNASCDSDQDLDTTSLLNLLKYPLRHLSEILQTHSVNTPTEGLSQFPHWQSQKLHISPVNENAVDVETMDIDSGKYSLVTQGIFMLLGHHKKAPPKGDCMSYDEVKASLGVTHILVFLELYISSYLFQRKEMENDSMSGVDQPLNKTTESEKQALIEDQEIILQALQILKLLLSSVPSLVKCIMNRTSSSAFLINENVIIIDDPEGSPEELKNAAALNTVSQRIPGCSADCSTQGPQEERGGNVLENENGKDAMGSFRSLLLPNLEKLIIHGHLDDSLSVSHAALNVLVAMTTVCEKTELERIFLVVKRGCLKSLLAKDSSSSTILPVMSLLKNLLPCKGIQKILCSQTDSCILLKIYQCVCGEEDKDVDDVFWGHFLLQVVEFVKSVAFSHSDSIDFLLQTDCQCSLEIIRCLVLVLHDKVNYLLGLDSDIVTSEESLTILRVGVTLLVILCTHSSYSTEHRMDVEHHYVELIYKVMILYKNIKDFIPEVEALGVQDLLDMEQIDEIEWSLESDDDDDCMEIDG